MKNTFSEMEILFPKDINIPDMVHLSPEEPFSDNAVAWLNALSAALKQDPGIREYPDVVSFSFFSRKANILHLKREYCAGSSLRLGKGLAFHIAPPNVPVIFAYSMAAGLLAGNCNIIKTPSRHPEQVKMLTRALLLVSREKRFRDYSQRIALVRYDTRSDCTACLSSRCDARIVWGSDTTINNVRKHRLSPHAIEVPFGTRYSLCVINAGRYLQEQFPRGIAEGFYNDAYLFDQNACTSPHLIIWLGSEEDVQCAKVLFWNHLHGIVKARYRPDPITSVDKMTAFCNQAVHLTGIEKMAMPDNLIWRVELKELPQDIFKYKGYGGYFFEYRASSLSEVARILTGKYQTLSYYGMEKESLTEFMAVAKPRGADRIVPIGRTMDFALTWDGINLIDTLSRKITVL